MANVYRLAGSAYRSYPESADVHAQLLLNISSPSTVDNEGGGWLATGPFGTDDSGVSFASLYEADNNTARATNRVLVLDEYVYYYIGDGLFRLRYNTEYQDGSHDGFVGNPWVAITGAFSNVESGRTGRNTGIYACMIAQPTGGFNRYIVGAYCVPSVGANYWKGFRYNVDRNVIEETVNTDLGFTADDAQGGVKAEILWNNKLYFIGASSNGVAIFDPGGLSFSTESWPTTDLWGPHDFCPFNGYLYCTNRGEYGGGGGSGLYIWKIEQSGISLAIDFATNGYGASSFASEQFQGRTLLFNDNEYLYAGVLCTDGSTNATRFFRFTSNSNGILSINGINPNVTWGDESGTWRARINAFIENTYSPDSSPFVTLSIDQAGETGVYRSQWRWTGPTTAAVEEDSAQGFTLHELRETARPHIKNGGGERIFNLPYGGPRADIINISPGTARGRAKFTYEIFNNPYDFPAGTPCTIQLRYSDDKHIPTSRATLTNTSVGTLAESNTVVRVPASASGTNYTFEWDYSSNGFTYQDFPTVSLFISTSGTS